MRICICGSRDGAPPEVIKKIFQDNNFNLTEDKIIHGGAKGVDSQAGEQAAALGFSVEVFAADWTKYGRAAGPIRNKAMIQTADVVYAIETAKKLGRKVVVIPV
jgi:hypothetical protein